MAHLRLLGGASLEREGVSFSGPEAQRHRLALLAVLAAAHPHGVQREKLLGLLWPDREPERARNLLNQAIHHVRRAVGPRCIVSTGGELRLDPDTLPCDLVRFEEALEAGRRRDAVAWYQGPFLDGFHLGGTVDFDHWLEAERGRLAERFRGAVEELAAEAEARGDADEAVTWWRRRAGDEPLNSRVTVRLARALGAWGDVAGAVRHLRVHERLLEEEGVAPPPELRALEEELRQGAGAADHSKLSVGPASWSEETSGAPSLSRGEGRPTPAEGPGTPGALGVAEVGDDVEAVHEGARGHEIGTPGDGWGGRRALGLGGGMVVALAAGAVLATGGFGAGGEGDADEEPPSVAVLPFENLGPEEDERFAQGITEELTAALASGRAVNVLAPVHSNSPATEGGGNLVGIGEELGADYVVQGSLRWEEADGGRRVRVSARLVRISEGRHLWAATYVREPQELFGLSLEITEGVLRELGAGPPMPDGRLVGRSTDDLEAYDHFLQGNAYVARHFSEEAARAAITQYEQAVELDPDFLEAWRRLVQSRVWLGWVFDDQEEAPRAGEALDGALAVTEDHPEAHLARGWYLYYGERRYADALEAFEAARRARPGDGEILRAIGFLEQRLGQHERAVASMKEALAVRPRDAELAFGIGQMLQWKGRYEEAMGYYQRAFALAPDQDIGFLHPGYERLHLAMGDTTEARRARERGRELGGGGWMGGRAEIFTGDLPQALRRILAHPPPDDFGRMAWYDNVAQLLGWLGDEERRRIYADSLARLADRVAPSSWDRPRVQAANAAWVYAGAARLHRGEVTAGLSLARRGLRQETPFGDALVEPFVQGLAARVFVRAGRSEDALELLEAPGVIPGAFSTFELRQDPEWDLLRGDPRFERLLEPE